jgi:hypothetical protein
LTSAPCLESMGRCVHVLHGGFIASKHREQSRRLVRKHCSLSRFRRLRAVLPSKLGSLSSPRHSRMSGCNHCRQFFLDLFSTQQIKKIEVLRKKLTQVLSCCHTVGIQIGTKRCLNIWQRLAIMWKLSAPTIQPTHQKTSYRSPSHTPPDFDFLSTTASAFPTTKTLSG